jgi:predicted nucleic acid-binding protein
MFTDDMEGRVLVFDSMAAEAYGLIMVERRAAGRPISGPDAMVASVGRAFKASVATRNVRDFEGCGISVIDPWVG